MRYLGLFWAVLVGISLTVQVGMNASAGRALKSPLWASAASFVVGLCVLGAVAALFEAFPSRSSFASAPAWAWLGGVLGAAYVASTIVLGPLLGASTLSALLVAGQLAAALIVDHFGLIGFPEHGVTAARLAGAALLVAGAALIVRP
jgi:bacterial/archaeal transporter family-2 protein